MSYKVNGYIPSKYDERDFKINKLVKSSVKLPEKYINPTPLKIFDQGESEMCVACALAQAKHIIEYKQTGDKDAFSPAYIYANRGKNDYDGEGMIPREALKRLKESGDCHYSQFSGFYTLDKAKEIYEKAKSKLDIKAYPYRISSYYRLNTMEEIKTAIYTLGFALVAYEVYDCMYEPKENGLIDYNEETKGESQGGHQMIAVGWVPNGLVVVNSWSDAYGTGFMENRSKGGLIIIPWDYKPTESWACTDSITEKEVKAAYRFSPVKWFKNILKKFFK